MYDELIEQMRSRASWLEFAIIATPSKADGNRDAILFRKAADAIEELVKENESLAEDLKDSNERRKKKRKQIPEPPKDGEA